MPRALRHAIGGIIYHVMNRGCGRMRLFNRPGDYDSFLRVLMEAAVRFPGVRILALCLMPNHFHLVVWPTRDGELSKFMFWLTMTHVQRWRHARKLVGLGPLYQGRYKSFPIEADEHFLVVARYVERNALRANLVKAAEHWQWSSLYLRRVEPHLAEKLLAQWPVDQPADWLRLVNRPQSVKEVEAIQRAIRRGRPFGGPAWQARIARVMKMNLEPGKRGRPKGSQKSGASAT